MDCPFSLRPIDPDAENADDVVDLFRQLRGQTDAALVPDYWPTFSDAFFCNVWADFFRKPEDYRAWILRDEQTSEDIGLVRVGKVDPFFFDYLQAPLPPNTGELHQIYLDCRYIGQDLGSLLYRQACDDLCVLGATNMFVSTYQANKVARGFYTRMGAEFLQDSRVAVTTDGRTNNYDCSFFLHRNLG